ncbi:hypothetical protein H8A97_24770 [Bradyrhizobium sp. Arg62]|uniref:hypothetical protein n=1 Tax=Bradyrhizobium brasilense TaxID=1419277 RepID=UPI001E4279AD|nr:hypothetical protein [Bradyrhizobium brasilense]MCC8948235.1 hypothetical protein [Bradyrhizobium brasilense]
MLRFDAPMYESRDPGRSAYLLLPAYPNTDHAGVAALTERRISAEEDLVILLSATSSQFRSVAEVIEEAEKEASRARLGNFSAEEATTLLGRPRREIYQTIDERIQIDHLISCGANSKASRLAGLRAGIRPALCRRYRGNLRDRTHVGSGDPAAALK